MSERRGQTDQIEGFSTSIAKNPVPSQTTTCPAQCSTPLELNICRSPVPLRRGWPDALGLCKARSEPTSHAPPAHAVPAGRALNDDPSAPDARVARRARTLARLATGMCRLRGAPRRSAALPVALGDADRLPPRVGRPERALGGAGGRRPTPSNRHAGLYRHAVTAFRAVKAPVPAPVTPLLTGQTF